MSKILYGRQVESTFAGRISNVNYDRTRIPTSYSAHYRPVQAGRVINVSILIALIREPTIIARLKVHSSIVDAIMPRASFYTLVTWESRNECIQYKAFLMVPFSLSPSLSLCRERCTTNVYDECSGRAVTSRQLVQHLAFRGAARRGCTRCSRILCPAIPGNSIPGNDFTPRVTRLYGDIGPLSLSVACQPARGYRPVVTRLQFVTDKRLKYHSASINVTLSELNKSRFSRLENKAR